MLLRTKSSHTLQKGPDMFAFWYSLHTVVVLFRALETSAWRFCIVTAPQARKRQIVQLKVWGVLFCMCPKGKKETSDSCLQSSGHYTFKICKDKMIAISKRQRSICTTIYCTTIDDFITLVKTLCMGLITSLVPVLWSPFIVTRYILLGMTCTSNCKPQLQWCVQPRLLIPNWNEVVQMSSGQPSQLLVTWNLTDHILAIQQ